MRHRTARWTVACLLGLILSAGIGLSAVEANTMMVEMAMAGDANAAGNGCAGCAGDSFGSGDCSSVCAASVFSFPAQTAIPASPMAMTPILSITQLLRGADVAPDPHPPRSVSSN
jgi:hypothetical protein